MYDIHRCTILYDYIQNVAYIACIINICLLVL